MEYCVSLRVVSSLYTVQKEEDSTCVLFVGTASAESSRDHPWLMSESKGGCAAGPTSTQLLKSLYKTYRQIQSL